MNGIFFTLRLHKKDIIKTIMVVYENNAYSSCSFDTLDNNWSSRLNLHYPSNDVGVSLFELIIASFISSISSIFHQTSPLAKP